MFRIMKQKFKTNSILPSKFFYGIRKKCRNHFFSFHLLKRVKKIFSAVPLRCSVATLFWFYASLYSRLDSNSKCSGSREVLVGVSGHSRHLEKTLITFQRGGGNAYLSVGRTDPRILQEIGMKILFELQASTLFLH